MSNIARRVGAGVAAVGIAAGIGAPIIEHQTRVPRTCEAHILVFEDGSWAGTQIVSKRGSEIAPAWDVTGPETQNTVTIVNGVPTYHSAWPVSQDGQECKILTD